MKNKLKKDWTPRWQRHKPSKAALSEKPDPSLTNHDRMMQRKARRAYLKEKELGLE